MTFSRFIVQFEEMSHMVELFILVKGFSEDSLFLTRVCCSLLVDLILSQAGVYVFMD